MQPHVYHAAFQRRLFPGAEDEDSLGETATLRSNEAPETGHKVEIRHVNDLTGWWWWWEIGASVLSIITIGLLVPILHIVDSKPLEVWTYSIRPNSLISILTTISKSAMTALTASCLSQLKWDHFQYRPNPLDHLQIYDDASRGPWGSFLLLVTGRLKVVTAWALALVTLVALAVEPSAQQILETSTRQSLLSNVTAQIGIAKNYTSKGLISSSQVYWGGSKRIPTPGLFSLQTSIAGGISGAVSPVNIFCPPPATECTWPPFSTLAICSSFSDLTATLKPDCAIDKFNVSRCQYEFPGGTVLTMTEFATDGSDTYFNSSGSSITLNDVPASRTDGVRKKLISTGQGGYNITEDTEVFSMIWNYCIKTYSKVHAAPTGIHTVEYTSVPLLRDDSVPAGLLRWDSFGHPSSDIIFNLTTATQTGLWQHLQSLLSQELISHFTGNAISTDFSVGEFMAFADLANMTKNIEDTLSNQVRSSAPGDNYDAEMWPGQAFYEETYWKVHWAWITLPVAEVLAAASLLVITIVVTKTQPLFKSSSLAFLYHGLENIDQDPELRGDWENRLEDLETRARYINVELREDANGSLKFAKVAPSL